MGDSPGNKDEGLALDGPKPAPTEQTPLGLAEVASHTQGATAASEQEIPPPPDLLAALASDPEPKITDKASDGPVDPMTVETWRPPRARKAADAARQGAEAAAAGGPNLKTAGTDGPGTEWTDPRADTSGATETAQDQDEAAAEPPADQGRPIGAADEEADQSDGLGGDKAGEAGPAETTPYRAAGDPPRKIGRCEVFTEIAQGGMATIYLGRWAGAGGFAKSVAVKALHPQYARDPAFVNMFLDEARVVARVKHPNVMPTIDLVEEGGELYIIMDYVEGATLANLLRFCRKRGKSIPLDIALRIITGVLHGLHAAHEATDERGEPMAVIHRDVSPENILVGVDGFARLIDFGVARAVGRISSTQDGHIKGKLSYLAPEQVQGHELNRQADVFAASIVLWETITGQKLFEASNAAEVAFKLLNMPVTTPSRLAKGVSTKLDDIVMRGLARSLKKRWQTAEDMAEALEKPGGLASHREVGRWVRKVAAKPIERSAKLLKAMEETLGAASVDAYEHSRSITLDPLGDASATRAPAEGAISAADHRGGASTTGHSPAAYDSAKRTGRFPVLPTAIAGALTLVVFGIWGLQRCGSADSPELPPPAPAATTQAQMPTSEPSGAVDDSSATDAPTTDGTQAGSGEPGSTADAGAEPPPDAASAATADAAPHRSDAAVPAPGGPGPGWVPGGAKTGDTGDYAPGGI